MGLREEIESSYIDGNGQVNPGPVPKDALSRTGNGLAITALYFFLLCKRNEARDPALFSQFSSVFFKCRVLQSPGLIYRSPQKQSDQEGWDDYICLAASGSISKMNMFFVRWMLNRGMIDHWVFNNVDVGKFTWKAWFGRSPAFVAHIMFANGKMPSIFLKIVWAFSIAFSGITDTRDSTARVLSYLMIETMNGMSGICTLASAIWSHRMRNKSMSYYVSLWLSIESDQDGNPLPNLAHPIVKYWVD